MGKKHKFTIQVVSFVTIMASSAGLYFAATIGADALSWALLGLTAAAMALALWVS
jgi:hypothetical protein